VGTNERHVVEYEPDTALRDTEQVPLLEEGGIEALEQETDGLLDDILKEEQK